MTPFVRLMLWPALLAGAGTARAQEGPSLSPGAERYLNAALDTIQAVTLGRDTLPWRTIRDSAFLLVSGARSPRDTYGAIHWALRRVNKHSFLQARGPGAVAEVLPGRVGYLRVPARGGPGVALADSLHLAVGALQDSGVCGWIVDLRGNGGGNMWPMLAGVGPLLGDSIVGRFGGGPAAQRWLYRRGAAGLLHGDGTVETITSVTVPAVVPAPSTAPLALLFDGGTGSSGEAVAVAFLGRANSRSFGTPTAGFATSNRGSRLSDGANMVVTTGYYRDRTGREYPEQLEPDSVVTGGVSGFPFPTDRVARAAGAWLARQAACRD